MENCLCSEKFLELINEIKDMKRSMDFMNDKFEQCMKELIESQKEKEELKETVYMMDGKVRSLEARVEELNNKLLFDNLEIAGIPCMPNEDCTAIAMSVAKAIHPQIQATDVAEVHRIGNPRDPEGNLKSHRSILVKFKSSTTRSIIYRNKKRLKDINTNTLGLSNEISRIFINENLTYETKKLFREANTLKKI